MTHYDCFAGIDVCKNRLDLYCHPGGQAFHVANTPAGIKKLLARLDSGSYAIGCEATGGYEDRLLVALSEAGSPGYCLHPADIRAFTRLKGRRAKTGRLDAEAIAMAPQIAVTSRKPVIRTKTQSGLKQMATVRRVLIAAINKVKSLLARLDAHQARRPLDKILRAHQRELKDLNQAIQNLIAGNVHMAERARRITSAPGAGPVLAAELIASMPELGAMSSRQAASLVGVAPHPRQSGTSTRPGRCQAGRANIRRVLYMAALSAIKAKPAPLYPFYIRLREAGKTLQGRHRRRHEKTHRYAQRHDQNPIRLEPTERITATIQSTVA